MPNDTVQDLPPLADEQSRSYSPDMVAALNLDKTKVLKVFADQKQVAEEYKLSTSGISCAIRRGSKSNAFYFVKWTSLSEEMKNDYIASNKLPEQRYQESHITYPTVTEVIKEFKNIACNTVQCHPQRV